MLDSLQSTPENNVKLLIEKRVHLVSAQNDQPAQILEKTSQELQREKVALLHHQQITDAQKIALRNLDPTRSIDQLLALDALLNDLNIKILNTCLPRDPTEKKIKLKNCGLTRIPNEFFTVIGQYTALTELYLTKNQLSTLPVRLEELTQLTTLGIADNPFTSLPASLRALLTRTHNKRYLPLLASIPTNNKLSKKLSHTLSTKLSPVDPSSAPLDTIDRVTRVLTPKFKALQVSKANKEKAPAQKVEETPQDKQLFYYKAF